MYVEFSHSYLVLSPPTSVVRITGITKGRSCTPEITTTPNTFTHQYEQAAKLLNTPFVGNLKYLDICITRTMFREKKISSKGTGCPEMPE